MGKVILGAAMSLDGFVNDRDGSVSRIYENFGALNELELIQDSMRTTGAVVMGRTTYEMGSGDYTGYEYQVPIFVVTHHAPENAARGENENLKFTFVTEGLESAIMQAKAAAGDKDVTIVGGANIAQQCLKAGLADELHLDIVPVILGKGLRFFEHLEAADIRLEQIKLVETSAFTHLQFRIVK